MFKRKKIVLVLFSFVLIAIPGYKYYHLTNTTKFTKSTTILVQPLDFEDVKLLTFVKNGIEKYYHFNVLLLKSKPIYNDAYYKPRNRYRADKLIKILKAAKTNEANFIIGITQKDISTTKGKIPDFGIMGLGYCPGISCVVSTFRIHTEDYKLLQNRLLKITLHEIGHNLGLPHCTNSDVCFMQDANASIQQIDKAQLDLCTQCKKKIGFNS